MNERREKATGWQSHRLVRGCYQGVMVGLACAVVWLVLLPDEPWVHQANFVIWAIFFADYAVRLYLAPDRRRFVRQNIPDLIAILPLDFLSGEDVLGLGRLLRLTRFVQLVRLLRAAVVLQRVSHNATGILQTNGLAEVLAITCVLIVTGGISIWLMEPEIGSVGDGIWWSVVTATTVGYGDISPKTIGGRVVASLLMIAGIGTISMVTGSVATYFIRRRQTANPNIEHIRAQLLQWEDLSSAERQQLAVMLKALADH